jgi:hypothetical protein
MKDSFFYRRVIGPIRTLLTQGITPEKIALSLAFGIVLGVFPLLGSTTILCAAIQLVNYLAYPLQLLFLVPFIRVGERLFGAARSQLSLAQMLTMAHADFPHAVASLWVAGVHSMSAWLLIGPPAIVLLYFVLSRLLRQLAASNGPRRDAPEAA